MALSEYFEGKKNLYTQSVKGYFRNLKSFLNIIFISIYLFTPFLRWDRGAQAPDQAIFIDLANSKLYFLSIEIWPNEVYYLMGILILAALSLFFVTSLFGRVWCGYACFQTVWSDIFLGLEKIFQGDRNKRIILDRKNNFEKFFKKFLTHLSWILVSLITGYGFVAYFNDAHELFRNLIKLNLSFDVIGWTLGIAFATYIMAGFAREHVCTFMCPYSRFQSAMFDKNTLIITYDAKRGEPRGKHKQGESFENRGDCIDCKQCVVVCPQGIDIRNGLQMECIACGLCIDACDDIMDKVGRPRGLIRYDTEKNITTSIPENKFKLFTPRFFFYSAIIMIVSSLMLAGLLNKTDLELNIIPNRNPLFITLSDGSIRNSYKLKIENKTHQDKIFSLKILSPQNAHYKIESYANVDSDNLPVGAIEDTTFSLFITLDREFIENLTQNEILIQLEIADKSSGEVKKLSAVFVAR